MGLPMCFCNTYQYLMRKEIQQNLFSGKRRLYISALHLSFNYGSCYLKDECYNQYPMKNSALYLYPPSHLSQTVIPTQRIYVILMRKPCSMILNHRLLHKGTCGRFLVLGMYTMYLSFAFTFLLVVGLVSGAAFYALPFYPRILSLRHLSYTSLYF